MSNNELKRIRQGIKQNMTKLEETLMKNRKLAEKAKRKDYINGEPKLDVESFYKRMQDQARKRDKSIEMLKKQQEIQNNYPYKPSINTKSKELTENMPSFQKKIEKLIRPKTSERIVNNKYQDINNDYINEKKTLSRTPSKKIYDEDVLRADKFYKKNMDWKKQAETKSFYRKIQMIKDNNEKEKIPKNYFKPKLNNNRNIVKTSFDERNNQFYEQRRKDIERVEKDMYNYSFRPNLYKKYKNTYY